MPKIYISYTWKDRNDQEALLGESLANKLYTTLKDLGYECFIDDRAMEYGSDITNYARVIGRGDLVIAILSEAYLRSRWCMEEMNNIYNRNLNDPDEIQAHLIPVVLPGFDRSDENMVTVRQFWNDKITLLSNEREAQADTSIEKKIELYQSIKSRVSRLFELLTETLLFEYQPDDFDSLLDRVKNKLKILEENREVAAPEGENLFLFLDRSMQRKAFDVILGEKGHHKPFVLFTRSYLEDEADSLVKSLMYEAQAHYEHQLDNDDLVFAPVDTIHWPEDNEHFESVIKKRIAKQNTLKAFQNQIIRNEDAKSLLQEETFEYRTPIFEFFIDARYWHKKTMEEIQWLVDTYWNVELPERSLPIFIFVHIGYELHTKPSRLDVLFRGRYDESKIEKELDKNQFGNAEYKILDRLTPIEKRDLEIFRKNHQSDFDLEGEKWYFKEVKEELQKYHQEQDMNSIS